MAAAASLPPPTQVVSPAGAASSPVAAAAVVSAAPAHHQRKGCCHPRWIVLSIASSGGLLASVQSTSLIIAFAVLLDKLQCNINTLLWIILAYQLVITATVLAIGKVADAVGRAFLFKVGYFLFVLGSLLGGFSKAEHEGMDLIGYRVVMGLGAAVLFTNSMAIVADEFIPFGQLGLAQGVFQLAFATGTVLGPVVGGVLGDADWRWIFWINVPIGGLAWLASLWTVHDPPLIAKDGDNTPSKWQHFKHKMQGFDGVGVFMSMTSLLFFVMCMTTLVLPDKALATSSALAGMSVACVFCGLFFLAWEWKGAKIPIMPLSIFNDRTFSVAIFTSVCMGFARGNITNLLIFFLQGPYGKSPLDAGILMIPLGAGIMFGGLVSGKLTDLVGVRLLSVIGCTIATACTIGLGFVDHSTPYGDIAVCITIQGLGFGLFNSPNAFAGFITVKPLQRGVASGIRMMSSMVAAMISIIMVFVFILNALTLDQLLDLFVFATPLPSDGLGPFMDSVQNICWISAALTFVSALLSFIIPGDVHKRGATPPKPNSVAADKQQQQQPQADKAQSSSSNGKEPSPSPSSKDLSIGVDEANKTTSPPQSPEGQNTTHGNTNPSQVQLVPLPHTSTSSSSAATANGESNGQLAVTATTNGDTHVVTFHDHHDPSH